MNKQNYGIRIAQLALNELNVHIIGLFIYINNIYIVRFFIFASFHHRAKWEATQKQNRLRNEKLNSGHANNDSKNASEKNPFASVRTHKIWCSLAYTHRLMRCIYIYIYRMTRMESEQEFTSLRAHYDCVSVYDNEQLKEDDEEKAKTNHRPWIINVLNHRMYDVISLTLSFYARFAC